MGKHTAGKRAALASWAQTVDRTARTRPARRMSPSHIDWHIARLPESFDNATDEQRHQAAEAARRLWFMNLAAKRWGSATDAA